MPAAKHDHQIRARQLRAAGWSLRAIAAELDVALSSASIWVRDVGRAAAPGLIPEDNEPAAGEPGATADVARGSRRCSRCEQELPVAAFNRHRDGRQWWCRACFRAYYRSDPGAHRERNNALKRRRVQEARAFVLDHLIRHPCLDCDERDPVVLEFDHRENKRNHVAELVNRGVRLPVLVHEIAHCDVVCANCHRRRTAVRGGWRRLASDPDTGRWRSPRHRRNVLFALEHLRAAGCVDCGARALAILDFDHRDGKTAAVMRLAAAEASLERLVAEIRRCDVRCANCHRRRTATERGYYRTRG